MRTIYALGSILLALGLTGCASAEPGLPQASKAAGAKARSEASGTSFHARSEQPVDNGFAEATAGFADCDLGSLYIDEYDKTTRNPYLQSMQVHRCDQDDILASYCINENFHGPKVNRLAVPKTTTAVFALYFKPTSPRPAQHSSAISEVTSDHHRLLKREPSQS